MASPRNRASAAIMMGVATLACTHVSGEILIDGFASGDVPADLPSAASGQSHERAMLCLTQAIYYEAGSEPVAGQQAVAQVVINRLRHPAFPKSVCGVVFDGAWRSTGCQFTFACDGSLYRQPAAGKWAQAQSVAAQALAGYVDNRVGASTHYHASWMTPYWSPSMVETARIGGHVFYQMAGTRGSSAMLTAAYAGIEPDPASLASTIPVPVAWAARRPASNRSLKTPPPPPASRPATFSVWGLDIATVATRGQTLTVHPDRGAPGS